MSTAEQHVARVVVAGRRMVEHGGPLPVPKLAAEAGCSARQLARSFALVAGVTPTAFGRAVRTGQARALLRERPSVTAAIFDAGFGSVRGFYEHVGPTLGMAPAEFAGGAAGQVLRWTVVPTSLGLVLAAAGDLGLAAVRIGPSEEALLGELRRELPGARLERDDASLGAAAAALALLAEGGDPGAELPVDLRGTAFQARVWDALRRIPAGQTRSYQEVAASIGAPTSVRAVARACAANPVALVVPCHRVVRSDGGLGGYRWGLAVKEQLLRRERLRAG